MNKVELISAVAQKLGATKKDTKDFVETVFEVITEALQEGESVKISDFGKFEVKELAERNGRNPQTGETMVIPASKKVSFKTSKNLKASL